MDNSGNEFYLACAANRFDTQGKCTFYVTTDEAMPVSVTISHKSVNGNSGKTVTVRKGSTVSYEFPTQLTLGTGAGTFLGQKDFAIHFKAAGNRTIIIYGINEDLASTDAFLALPVFQTVTREYEFFVMSYTRPTDPALNRINSFILLVGTEDNTTLTISVKVTPNGRIVFGPKCSPFTANSGQTTTCIIGKGETFFHITQNDLTGTKVVANKPITFLTGHQCAQVPSSVTACDHLIEQIPPVENLGFQFVLSPSLGRRADAYRFLAARDGTVVRLSCGNQAGTLDPLVTFTLNSGEFAERVILTTRGFCFVEADLPIIVMQYALGHSDDNNPQSDPFIIYTPPFGQFKNFYTIVFVESSIIDSRGIRVHFNPHLALCVPIVFCQLNQILFDGTPLTNLPGSAITTRVRDRNGIVRACLWRYEAHSSIALGDHTLEHTNPRATFSVLVSGYERENTYGYTGGMNLNPVAGAV